ncbi:MAG: hypothetical protein BMS9Abin07_1842 [Acidimicrobiia bacterium]|nr:MAG: hypothetical protein BMS9Abin07_1842 [Acidimicrobiia bacterium]
MVPTTRWMITLIAAVSLVAAACAQPARPVTEPAPSSSIAPTSTSTSTTAPTTTSAAPGDGDVVARCGAAEFAFGTTEPAGTPLDEEAQRAFDEAGEAVAVEWFGEGKGFGGGWKWIVIERNDERMVFLGEGPDGYADVTIEHDGDTWQAAGWGGCRFMTSSTLAGFGIGAWVTDPDSKPDPQSSTLDVLLMERACANGEPPVGREIRPVVLPGEETIEIILLIEGVEGGATCPGNPWHATTIDIGEPIGERTLVDRHVSPGLIRPWPPTETSMSIPGDKE